jgi:hypothetical protein
MSSSVPDFRAASPISKLGHLVSLRGNWSGHGFNLIARPDRHPGNNGFYLKLSPTDENLRFSSIGGAIPNRGSREDDIELYGVHYLQQIRDHGDGSAIHLEPGVWLITPPTGQPEEPQTVWRLASLPHGSAILAQGTSGPGSPDIPPANTVPFPANGNEPAAGTPNKFPEYDLSSPSEFRTPMPTPEGNDAAATPEYTQAEVTNPNSLLTAAIANQNITSTTVLDVKAVNNPASQPADVANIPFLQRNAEVLEVRATFWIETVQFPDYADRCYLQLQYSQTVLLKFNNFIWPHVSVATLKKVT